LYSQNKTISMSTQEFLTQCTIGYVQKNYDSLNITFEYSRKFPLDYFITLEDYRDLQLEKLL